MQLLARSFNIQARVPGQWGWFLEEISLHIGQWGADTCSWGSWGDEWHQQVQKEIGHNDEPHEGNRDRRRKRLGQSDEQCNRTAITWGNCTVGGEAAAALGRKLWESMCHCDSAVFLVPTAVLKRRCALLCQLLSYLKAVIKMKLYGLGK